MFGFRVSVFSLGLVASIISSWVATQSFAAIYGPDNRKEVEEVKGMEQVSSAIATMVGNIFIKKNPDGSLEITDVKLAGKNLCGSGKSENPIIETPEAFLDQPSIGSCTGFLIAPRILVTAGHCYSNEGINSSSAEYCKTFSWYFGYRQLNGKLPSFNQIDPQQIGKCKRVIHAENLPSVDDKTDSTGRLLPSDKPDFAIIELENEIPGAIPIPISKRGLGKGTVVYTIGHPWGLPAKHSGQASVSSANHDFVFTVPLDSLGGNSGGPVLNTSKEVEGVLISGHQFDSYLTTEGCHRINKCKFDGSSCRQGSKLFPLNQVMRMKFLEPYINPL